jgi:hypothetical protein
MIDDVTERRTDATTRFETFWLIVRGHVGAGGGPPEILTLEAGGGVEGDGKILPVFSFEEEALLFLCLCGFSGGWRASKSEITDLALVLSDACPEVRSVALDPIPEIGTYGLDDLVSLSREAFFGLLCHRTMMLRTGLPRRLRWVPRRVPRRSRAGPKPNGRQ